MEVREARSLLLLAQLKSIKAVAETLHVSPPSVHKHLKTLEFELGVPAYERDGRLLRLTEAATAILPYLHQMVAEYDTAARVIGEWRGVKRGLVRIGSGPVVATCLAPDMLARFFARYPDVNVVLQTGQVKSLVEKLINGTLDVAFIAVPELAEESNLSLEMVDVACEVVEMPMVFVSGAAQRPRLRCSIGDLANTPFVLYEKGSAIDRVMDRYFAEFSFRPRVIIRSDYTETIKAMVQKGLGISLLPFWPVRNDVHIGKLWHIKPREAPLKLKIVLAMRQRAFGAPAVRAFVDVVKNYHPEPPH
jgi:LysR family transcriptional regulator, transcription activator of glutamate synthase operon